MTTQVHLIARPTEHGFEAYCEGEGGLVGKDYKPNLNVQLGPELFGRAGLLVGYKGYPFFQDGSPLMKREEAKVDGEYDTN